MKTIQTREKEQVRIKSRKRKIRRAIGRLIFMLLFLVAVLNMTRLNTLEQVDNRTDWQLLLVNYMHSVPEDYSFSLIQLKNEQSVDERIYPELQEMMNAARAEGIFALITSSYRTKEMQQALFTEKVEEYKSNGYLNDKAERLAKMWVALPGTSEHQVGLAVDIGVDSSQTVGKSQSSSDVHQWLMANCYKFGFILRYPEGKSDITGVNYEPWHYRYVGKAVAKEITEKGICFEEYLAAGWIGQN